MSEIFYKNGNKYKSFPSGIRKICKIENCNIPASGECCRKHNIDTSNLNEKKCKRCFNIKKLKEDFTDNDIEYTHCKFCRNYKRITSLKTHDKRRRFILQLKIDKGGKCVDCKITDLEVLEFDHIDPKNKFNEIKRISNYQGMKEEAGKCELRCVNCHLKKIQKIYSTKENASIRAQYGQNYRKIARDYVNNIKIESKRCVNCNFFDINNLQILNFDHIDEKTKQYNISHMVGGGNCTESIQKEIDKCQILCGNCHRKKTLRQFNYPILEIINKINETKNII